MKKTILLNLSLLIFVNLLIKPIYIFGIDRKLQLIVGQSEYGFYIELLTFTLLFQALNDLGLYNYTIRHFSQTKSTDTNLVSNLFGVKLIFSVVYLAIISIITFLHHDYVDSWKLILHLAFNQILIQFIFFFRSFITGAGFYKTDSILSILDRLLLIIIGFIFLYTPSLQHLITIPWFVNLQTLSLIVCFTIALFIYFQKISSSISIQFNWSVSKKILTSCFPFILIYFFNIAYTRQDVIWIGNFVQNGNEENGLYASSMRLYEAFTMISLAFGSLALGMFSKFYETKKMLTEVFVTMGKVLLFITIGISVFIFFNANWVNQLLYHQDSELMDKNLKIIMIGFIPGSLSFLLGAFIQAIHREKKLVLIYLSMTILNGILNYFLVPTLASYGAAWSMIITQFAVTIAILYYSIDLLESNALIGIFKSGIGFLVTNVFLYYIIQFYCGNSAIWIQISLSALITISLGFSFKLIDLAEIKELSLKRENI
ncbi:MAG: oligosaccharide flippase family protein [Saprospiraceae bacterium]|nr:polysaccharide biosynthesis C-terminal domain-containing protein [Saprospiraceae bacterium]